MDDLRKVLGTIVDLYDMYSTSIVYRHFNDARIYGRKLIEFYDRAFSDGFDVSLLRPVYDSCKEYVVKSPLELMIDYGDGL
jgi:hypothetical protein